MGVLQFFSCNLRAAALCLEGIQSKEKPGLAKSCSQQRQVPGSTEEGCGPGDPAWARGTWQGLETLGNYPLLAVPSLPCRPSSWYHPTPPPGSAQVPFPRGPEGCPLPVHPQLHLQGSWLWSKRGLLSRQKQVRASVRACLGLRPRLLAKGCDPSRSALPRLAGEWGFPTAPRLRRPSQGTCQEVHRPGKGGASGLLGHVESRCPSLHLGPQCPSACTPCLGSLPALHEGESESWQCWPCPHTHPVAE